jgi:hypothetical protein
MKDYSRVKEMDYKDGLFTIPFITSRTISTSTTFPALFGNEHFFLD